MNVHPGDRAPALPTPPPAIQVWGQKTASRRKNWTATPNIWEHKVVTPASRQGNDIMHARYYSNTLGRFLSVDPVAKRKAVKHSQAWNRYSYVNDSPVRALDPLGRDLHIVFDFGDSKLSIEEQKALMTLVAKRFKKAGVKSVTTYNATQGQKPSFLTRLKSALRIGKTRVVYASYHRGTPYDEAYGKIYGKNENPWGMSAYTHVFSGWVKAGKSKSLNYLVNVTSHELGHPLLYPTHAADQGPAQPGTVMEPGLSLEALQESIREFSPEDAAILQERLNEE